MATQFLNYEIHLTDKAEATAQQALFPFGIRMAPTDAAAAYSAPILEFTDPFVAPCIRSPWIWSAQVTNRPRDQATFTRKSGGWFGLSFLFGTTTTYIWVGLFKYGSPGVGTIEGEPTEVVDLTVTTFTNGFELPVKGEEWDGTTVEAAREASRHVGGFGYACRGVAGAQPGGNHTHQANENGAAARAASWERFYWRPRLAPTTAYSIWQVTGTTSPLSGVRAYHLPSNQIGFYQVSPGGVETPLFTSAALEIGTYYKIDLVFSFATSNVGAVSVGSYFEFYINGVEKFAKVNGFTTATGLGVVGNHLVSYIGPYNQAAHTGESDFDDWRGSPPPNEDSFGRYVGLDWLNGSRIMALRAKAFNAGNTYPGDFRQLLGWPGAYNMTAASILTTAVSAATLAIDLAVEEMLHVAGVLGLQSMRVSLHSSVSNAAHDGTLGWEINGGTLDLAAVDEIVPGGTNGGVTGRMYRPSGISEPEVITSIELRYQKAAQVSTSTVAGLAATVELIGVFGNEDVKPEGVGTPVAAVPSAGSHNSHYEPSPWARSNLTRQNPVIIHSGTYVGNGTGQDLIFRVPVHWIWIRRVTGGNTGAFMHAADPVGHRALEYGTIGDGIVQMCIDPSFIGTGAEDDQEQRTLVRLGAEVCVNAAGSTYQYVAFCDPGARFGLTGSFGHATGQTSPQSNLLVNPTFLPGVGFFMRYSYTSNAAVGMYFKGIGHAAASLSLVSSGTPIVDALTMAEGSLQSQTAMHLNAANTPGFGYSLFRKDDGSGDDGVGSVVQYGSYVGTGGTRTVGFSPTTGKRPLFVIVVPMAAAPAIYRDPSETGTISRQWHDGTVNAATGITAGGIDEFTVGTALNALGTTYEWFAFVGGVDACNGGFSCDGEFIPVDPETLAPVLCDDESASNFNEEAACEYGPGDDPNGTTCTDPLATNFGGALPCLYGTEQPPGGECVDGETESTCITETTNLVNLALFEIGVSEMLTNYCTQMTREAVIARTVFNSVVRTVLHAYPWPFATKYATLVTATNQPTHADWTRAYRVPADCIFPRRLVASRGTGVDPEPPAFMLSSEGAGGLLFTNQAAAVLEYTCRPGCVAVIGDALFLETLKWKLGAVLAPPLTRMDAPAARCQAEYVKCLELANAIKKPGVPGVRATVDAASPDAAAACLAANIQVVNRGLLRIGCQTVANLATDQSRPAVAATLILEDEIRATLRDYPWKFAKRYDAALAVVGGTATVSANPDWQYSYRLPTDYVMVRRLVADGTGRKFEDAPPPWEVGTDATGDLLFTDVIDPNLEYTARINCAVQKGDDLFRDALAWRLAAALAPSLAQVDPSHPEQVGRGPDAPPNPGQRISHKPNHAGMRAQAVRYAQAMYRLALERARIQDANEGEPEDPPDAEWIRGR